jgi:Fe-S oxidoreductase
METFEEIKDKIKNKCLEREDPQCISCCPFRLDVRDFISNIRRGGFNLAYRQYSNAVGFPAIVSEICGAPCKNECPRAEAGGAIELGMLERACVDYASNLKPNNYNLQQKNKKVAIIGAGMSGLACALRLTNKKYSVTVFEKSERIGGSLWDVMSSDIFLEDINRQFMYEKYELKLNTEITDITSLIEQFDAVYVATGKDGNSFGLLDKAVIDGVPFATKQKGVFAGGMLLGADMTEAIAQGLTASNTLEFYLKTDNMKSAPAMPKTKLTMDTAEIEKVAAVVPANSERYTKEEAQYEAQRCILCRCDICEKYCPLMKYFGLMPKRIEGEVHITIHPGTLDGNGTVATRLISTCNQCGLCGEVCPQDIDVGMFLRMSHNAMRDKDAMPWAFHEFWLRDLDFANSSKAAFFYKPSQKSRYMFFPGCQLGASNPEYVLKSYEYLLGKMADTSLCLMCCGAPAAWSGDHEKHLKICDEIKSKWEECGRPVMIFACQSCRKFFADYMPEIQSVSLYEIMLENGISYTSSEIGKEASVFDPCSSRYFPETQKAVRTLLENSAYKLKPLRYEGSKAQCCSWGAQISTTNPLYTKRLVDERCGDGDLPYVVYCSNCRDVFAGSGKEVKHILDIIFGLSGWKAKKPTFSARLRNREYLRRSLAEKYCGEKAAVVDETALYMTQEVENKLDRSKILEDDVRSVIDSCERHQRTVTDGTTKHEFGYGMVGHMTLWVEYAAENDGWRVFNAYTHRMKIEREEVWNGRKQDLDDLQ